MEELSSIVEATKKLNSTLDLGELIHIILQIATRQTGAGRGTVFLVDAEKNEIWSLVGLGLEQQVIRLPADRGIAGWVTQNGKSLRLEMRMRIRDSNRTWTGDWDLRREACYACQFEMKAARLLACCNC